MALSVHERALALAQFFVSGMTRGRMVDFAWGKDDGTLRCAETGTNYEEGGVCSYDDTLQTQIPGPDNTIVLLAPHSSGSVHIFICYPLPDDTWFDPIYYLGDLR